MRAAQNQAQGTAVAQLQSMQQTVDETWIGPLCALGITSFGVDRALTCAAWGDLQPIHHRGHWRTEYGTILKLSIILHCWLATVVPLLSRKQENVLILVVDMWELGRRQR